MTYTCLSTQHDSSKGVKIASIWNMCILDRSGNNTKLHVFTVICWQSVCSCEDRWQKSGGGLYTFFSQTIEKQKKKTLRYLQTNYRSLQMNYRYLQTVQYIPIRYSIEKVQKRSKSLPYGATIWFWGGGLANIVGTGGGVRPGGGGGKNKGGRREFSTWFLIFLCRLPVCVYSVYVNGVAACWNFIWLLICI